MSADSSSETVISPSTPTVNMVKPGFKTTEFWLSLVVTVCGLLTASGVIPTGSVWAQGIGMVMAGVTALGYTGSRMNVKANA